MDLYETKSGYPPSQVIIDTIIERKLESGEWSVG